MQLGPVEQALAPVGDQVRLGGAPAGQHGRPLLGPAQVEQLLAALEHAAVDVAHDHGRQLARLDGHHHLVQQGHPGAGLAQPDQGPAGAHAGQGDQVGLAPAVGGGGRLLEAGEGGRGLALAGSHWNAASQRR